MALTKVTRNGQVTIPIEMRRQVGIDEGDFIELDVVGDHLILVPKKLIDKSQTYFRTCEWQAAEREAQVGIDEGRVQEFSTIDELLAGLHSGS